MTTAHCAKFINELVGERIVDDRFIRNRVQDGYLKPLNSHRRERERIRISAAEFLRYIQQHHAELFEAAKQRLAA